MPLSRQDLAAIATQNKPDPKPGNYAAPSQDLDKQIQSMPNEDKLTRVEKSIYKALPGVSSSLGAFSQKLDQFDQWAGGIPGKLLTVLDAGAEGFERTMGLFAQMQDPNFDYKDLKAAWYAGGLTADVTNLPQFVYGQSRKSKYPGTEKIVEGSPVVGLKITNDLPGAKVGLADARQKIKALMAQGVPAKDALAMVRDEYYNGLGALALRAQLNDMYSHVLLDPLNVVSAWFKPVQALKVRRLSALSKIAGTTADVAGESSRILKLAETATDAAEALRHAEDAYQLALAAGDVAKARQIAEALPNFAKKAGDIKDLTKYTDEIARIAKIADNPEEAAKFTKFATAQLGKKQLTTADKAVLFLTGGDPLRPSEFVKKLEKIPGLGIIAKGVQLTPESRARELATMFSDNFGANFVARVYQDPNAEVELVNLMNRVHKGGTGSTYGHAMSTLEGRTIHGLITKSKFDLTTSLAQYQKIAPQREFFALLQQSLGVPPDKLFKMIDENPTAVLSMLAEKGDPLLTQLLQTGALNVDELTALPKMLKDMPLNKDMFFGEAMDIVETAMMRQSVLQFGIKEKGVITRWSEAVKSAEALAFLKLSPSYPVRNFVNNEFTMMARGLFGVIDNPAIDDFWKTMGISPQRLLEEGLSSEAGKNLSKADKILQEALEGGKPNKIKEAINNLKLGALDASAFSRKLEQSASRRATTLGTMQYLRMQKPFRVREFIQPNILETMRKVAPGFEDEFDNVLKSARFMDGEFTRLLGENVNVNIESILDDATKRVGMDVRELMGDEVVEALRTKLPKAIQEGTLDQFKSAMRQQLNDHVEDLFQRQLENVVEQVKSQAVLGGPNVWNHKLADAQDLFWNAHIEYSMRMPDMTRLAREASATGDFTKARALWAQQAGDSRKFYDRAFRRVDAYIQGLEEGAAELSKRGAKIPFTETRKTFKDWKKSWEGFFSKREEMYESFWKEVEAAPKGQKPDILKVQSEINDMYLKKVAEEDEFMRLIDDQIASMIDDPDLRKVFMNARDQLGQLRATDKTEVIRQYEVVQGLKPEERGAAWAEFWQKRTARFQEMKGLEAQSLAIQQGAPNAVAMFQNPIAKHQTRMPPATRDLSKRYGIKPQELKNVVNKFLRGEYTDEAIEGAKQIENAADIPPELAREALRARLISGGGNVPKGMSMADYLRVLDEAPEQAAQKAQGIVPNFNAEYKKTLPAFQPLDESMDLANYGRILPMLDEVVDNARAGAKKTPMFLKDLPEDLQKEVMRAVEQIRNESSAVRYRAMKFGEWRRDSALLNYNRRTNFDNWLAHGVPFGFWTTGSMQKWAIESIDRPAMITNYLRTKKFMDTAGLEQEGVASRTKGKIRVPLPFAPEWMGEAFVDPMRLALPFDNWLSPVDQWNKEQSSVNGRTERLLDQMLQEGKISEQEYQEAITDKTGGTWDYARSLTMQNDGSDRYDAWDFATSLQAPHAPLVWAYNAAFGDTEDIGPFAPMSRIMRNAATVMGVEDWNNSKWNIEAKIRKQMGLPAFDKWDEYRIKRAASNLTGEGKLSPQEAIEAITIQNMIETGQMTVEEGKQNEAYKLAVARSNQEFTGGVPGFIGSLLGLTVTSVPEGEANQRALQDDFSNAYTQYREANDSLEKFIKSHPGLSREQAEDMWEQKNPKLFKQADALGEFFDAHPEYESRLALFDKPEEQIQKFMVDEVWRTYNELPKINKDEVRKHLGDEFQSQFIDSSTRNTDNIPAGTMAVWLKMMHTDPLGGLTADQRLLVDLYGRVKFTDPETSWRVEVFYDTRKQTYSDFYELQSGYYETPNAQRKAYLNQNKQLVEYWDFRRKFMMDNPDLVPYLTDDEKAIARAKNQTRTQAAVPTAQELQIQMSPALTNIIQLNPDELPPVAERELERIARENGMTLEALMGVLGLK